VPAGTRLLIEGEEDGTAWSIAGATLPELGPGAVLEAMSFELDVRAFSGGANVRARVETEGLGQCTAADDAVVFEEACP
jgi:hypothetical protein